MNSREIVVKALDKIIYEGGYSNIVLTNILNNDELSPLDKSLVTEIVYGTIKYKYSIDLILKDLINRNFKEVDKYIINILRSAIYQIKYLDKIPEFAAVNEAVTLAGKKNPKLKGFVNGVLRNYLRSKDKYEVDSKDYLLNLSKKYSFESWMVKLFLKQYGKENAEIILKGLNEVPMVTVRVNSSLTNVDFVEEKLTEKGYKIEEGQASPEAIHIIKGGSVEKNELFNRGLLTVQDESAMLASMALDVRENDFVIDMCAAPGGKTTHIAEMQNGKGKVLAFDLLQNKLKNIMKNADRLKLENITCQIQDGSLYNEKLNESADRVITDVPCSGLGIIRKKPEIKWTKALSDLESLKTLQLKILENGARYLKPDGILVYSTCTLNKAENEDNVRIFLKNHREFKAEKISFGFRDNFIYSEEGFLTVLPDKYMDGFFIAKLKKNSR